MKRLLIMLTLGEVSKTIVYFVFSDKSLYIMSNFFKFQKMMKHENDEIYHATHCQALFAIYILHNLAQGGVVSQLLMFVDIEGGGL